ncbi:MAG: hypothetical protein LBR47_07845 [Spirochaetaceae bacterium]|jgi:threonine dehydrogenase-like Zn-dependent dehydrogenase|nr:hypothetical protein [Spirochaetaceae bacterium]
MKWSQIIKRFFTSVRGIFLAGSAVLLVLAAVILGAPPAAAVVIGGAGLCTAFFISMAAGGGAAAVVGEGRRLDSERNRERLEEAKQVSRKMGALRISDGDIKKLIIRLTYEADSYIQKVSAEKDAIYDPPTLDALDTAAAAVNSFLKESNAVSVEKHFSPGDEDTGGGDRAPGNTVPRDQTLRVLEESLRVLKEQNAVLSAGDMDAVLTDMSDEERDSIY